MRPFDDIDRIARARFLDTPAAPVRSAVQWALSSQRLRDVLHGVWLGHPLHPALVQVPVGSFVSATVLDMLPGQERAADTLICLGVASSVPAMAAGWADWVEGQPEQQRVGLVHAAANYVGLVGYAVSLWLRATGRRPAGVATALGSMTLMGLGATLGGHLSFRHAMGANHAQGVPHISPSDWSDLGLVMDLPARSPVKRTVGDVSVVVVRTGEAVHVLYNHCSHADAPLSDGEVLDEGGELCLRCPWHQSVFRLADGTVVHGPATAPQPAFDTRVVEGHLHAKVRMTLGAAPG